jgi:8-oxo-dGTP pyrophosphatase MutT (NUDIX family)
VKHPCAPRALADLQRRARREVDECVVGALIANASGRIFAQKRSFARKLFPGCWDIAGGHVEAGETLLQALEREVVEETGWRVARILDLVHVFDWESTDGARTVKKREFDFLVEVRGDLSAPDLEGTKHTEFRWIGRDSVEVLKENRAPGDSVIFDLVQLALTKAEQIQLPR